MTGRALYLYRQQLETADDLEKGSKAASPSQFATVGTNVGTCVLPDCEEKRKINKGERSLINIKSCDKFLGVNKTHKSRDH